MISRETVSISDTADRFARQVAPLYVANDWLGLGEASYDHAVTVVRDIAVELYLEALGDIRDKEFLYTSHATGRVNVIYWQHGKIDFMLEVESETHNSDGKWRNRRGGGFR